MICGFEMKTGFGLITKCWFRNEASRNGPEASGSVQAHRCYCQLQSAGLNQIKEKGIKGIKTHPKLSTVPMFTRLFDWLCIFHVRLVSENSEQVLRLLSANPCHQRFKKMIRLLPVWCCQCLCVVNVVVTSFILRSSTFRFPGERVFVTPTSPQPLHHECVSLSSVCHYARPDILLELNQRARTAVLHQRPPSHC